MWGLVGYTSQYNTGIQSENGSACSPPSGICLNTCPFPPLALPNLARAHQIVDIGIVAVVNAHVFRHSQSEVDVGVAADKTGYRVDSCECRRRQ